MSDLVVHYTGLRQVLDKSSHLAADLGVTKLKTNIVINSAKLCHAA
jgi:hypothetical protein